MRTRALITAAALAATLTACSGGGDAPDLECEEPSQRLVDFIAGGGEEDTGGIEIRRASAYRSPNYEKVWFVAGEFTAAGVEDGETAVWATNSLEGDGLTLAVDSMAQAFTVYPDANKTSFEIPTVSDDIDNAKACLDQAA